MPRVIRGSFAIGGTFLVAGTVLHPHEHVSGGTLQEQFHAMFMDPSWCPAHLLLLVGLALTTVAVVGFARTTPASLPVWVTRLAAVASAVATAAMVLHLIAKLDDTHITAGAATPLLYTHAAVETLTVPLFGITFTLLAAAGGRTSVLGNPVVAAPCVLGGLGYALAGATAPFIPTFRPLSGRPTIPLSGTDLCRCRDRPTIPAGSGGVARTCRAAATVPTELSASRNTRPSATTDHPARGYQGGLL